MQNIDNQYKEKKGKRINSKIFKFAEGEILCISTIFPNIAAGEWSIGLYDGISEVPK